MSTLDTGERRRNGESRPVITELIDELANSLFFTPPPQAYPAESHLRGIIGHLTFGAVLGILLAAAKRLRLLGQGQVNPPA